MAILSLLFTAVVTATIDICLNPIESGREEPYFCQLNKKATIETPFYQISLDPGILVGVDQEGRRMILQRSIRQSQIVATIYVDPDKNENRLVQYYCPDMEFKEDTINLCDASTGDTFLRYYATVVKSRVVIMWLSATALGADFLSDYEGVLESIGRRAAVP